MTHKQILDRVNLFVGTAGDHGQLYPGAEMPFGLVKLAPDTYPGAVKGTAHAGYDYKDKRILGFSHLRFGGTGNRGVGGCLLLQPTLRKDALEPKVYSAPYNKASEKASPGYYHAVLEPGIRVELTATEHVGFHRYLYPKAERRCILIDLGRGFTRVRDAHCIALNNRELIGEITSDQMHDKGWFRVFFSIQFKHEFEHIRFVPEGAGGKAVGASGPDGGLRVLVARFNNDGGDPVLVKVGVSCVSINQARQFIERETPDWDFDRVHENCRRAWSRILGRVEISGDGDEQALFYTHLYRSCVSPFHVTGPDGAYMGDDGDLRQAEGYTQFNGWSIWDTYRTKFPLLTLVEPTRMRDFTQSLVNTLSQRMDMIPPSEFFDYSGFLGTLSVRLELANTVLLDAFQKGIRTQDPEAAYDVMRRLALMEFSPENEARGYIPLRPDRTCECAYDNWATAQMARILGKDEDFALFDRRAKFYRNVWDPELRFLRARDEAGNWLDFPQDPTVIEEKYVYEGSMWHWRWAVVHAVQDLVELMGGRDAFVRDLTHFFENDLHNQGNEPGLHAPWMFAAAGAPWLSQKWVRQVLTEPMKQLYGTHAFLPKPHNGPIYRNTPDGLIEEMDDDDGCMAAWYVFSSMGLFPVCPGRPQYAVGAPLFEQVAIHGPAGRDFRIVSKGFARENWYIQSAKLNGNEFSRPWIGHKEIMEGGVLELEVGPYPNNGWGATGDLPW